LFFPQPLENAIAKTAFSRYGGLATAEILILLKGSPMANVGVLDTHMKAKIHMHMAIRQRV